LGTKDDNFCIFRHAARSSNRMLQLIKRHLTLVLNEHDAAKDRLVRFETGWA
jgi:hypothetical protein